MIKSLKKSTLVLFVLFCIMVFTSLIMTCKPRNCSAQYLCPLTDFNEFKRELNKNLVEIHQDVWNSIEQKKTPSKRTLLKLEGIMQQLDKRFKASKVIETENSMPPSQKEEVLDVCAEKYLGEKTGYPFFQTGWITTNCTNVKPLPSVVTILLNTMDYPEEDENKVNLVLRGIQETYPGVQVYLAAKNKNIRETSKHYSSVTVINVGEGSSMGYAWNQLISKVKTPYTLVGRDLVHFSWTARIRRQIRMISEMHGVGVAGGSYRNWTGHWKVGCRQSRKKNYILQYHEGYHYSSHSCMFCDDLEGPFVANTSLLKEVKFEENLPSGVIFEDFFLKVFDLDYLIVNCPDAMYFANGYSKRDKAHDRKAWQSLSTKWKFVRVLLPNGIMHSFSCEDISYKCSAGVTNSVTMPACCLEQYGKAMKYFNDLCSKHNILFELDSGSVLGAVKMSGLMPWDMDGDVSLLSSNFSKLFALKELIHKKGYKLNGYEEPKWDSKGQIMHKGYLKFHSPDIYTEMYGWPTLSGFLYLPPELQNPHHFTKVLVNGYWISSVFSPGLFARNRYGIEILKHSQSWIQVGKMSSSWARYKSGHFLGCKSPSFHACLDQFPADGNIAFQVPSQEHNA